jgi:hypothetical protein
MVSRKSKSSVISLCGTSSSVCSDWSLLIVINWCAGSVSDDVVSATVNQALFCPFVFSQSLLLLLLQVVQVPRRGHG